MTFLPAPPGSYAVYGEGFLVRDRLPLLGWGEHGHPLVASEDGHLIQAAAEGSHLGTQGTALGSFLGVEVPESTDPLIRIGGPLDREPIPVWLEDYDEPAEAVGWAFAASGAVCPILDEDGVPRIHRGPWKRDHQPDPVEPTWAQILTRADWTQGAAESVWIRPAKRGPGASATLDPRTELLLVHTGNAAPLVAGTAYTKVAFVAALKCDGDLTEARALLAGWAEAKS